MTKKEKKKATPVKKAEKKILFQAVQDCDERYYIIIGALSHAGLLAQYREEKEKFGVEDLKPSITDDDLQKIIKEFLGE